MHSIQNTIIEFNFTLLLGHIYKHHLVDVGHDRCKTYPTLAQLLDGIGKGSDLLGSLRGIDLYIVIDFVILRLSHE